MSDDDIITASDVPALVRLADRGLYLAMRPDGSEAIAIDGTCLTAADLRLISDVMVQMVQDASVLAIGREPDEPVPAPDTLFGFPVKVDPDSPLLKEHGPPEIGTLYPVPQDYFVEYGPPYYRQRLGPFDQAGAFLAWNEAVQTPGYENPTIIKPGVKPNRYVQVRPPSNPDGYLPAESPDEDCKMDMNKPQAKDAGKDYEGPCRETVHGMLKRVIEEKRRDLVALESLLAVLPEGSPAEEALWKLLHNQRRDDGYTTRGW